jgi:hypothetical protein
VRTITPELTAILRSRFQAAGDGFSGRIEVDSVTPPASSEPIDFTACSTTARAAVWFDGNLHTWTTVFGDGDPSGVRVHGARQPRVVPDLLALRRRIPPRRERRPASGAAGPFRLEGGPTNGGPWTTVLERRGSRKTSRALPEDFDLDVRPRRRRDLSVLAPHVHRPRMQQRHLRAQGVHARDTEGGIVSTTYRPKRINLNRNLRMGPDQASIELIERGPAVRLGADEHLPDEQPDPVLPVVRRPRERGAHLHRRHRQGHATAAIR